MENHYDDDDEGSNAGSSDGAPIKHQGLIQFDTFHKDDAASQLADPAAGSLGSGRDVDAEPPEGLRVQEYNALAYLSYRDYILDKPVVETASSSFQGMVGDPQPAISPPASGPPLSVEDLVRIAALKFVGSYDVMPLHITEVRLSEEESESVELTQFLLEAAQKVDDRLFDTAKGLLKQCHWQSSPTGNPIQRLVFYYSRALMDRIDRETGRVVSLDVAREQSFDLYKAVMTPGIQLAEFHRRMPFSQVAQFAGIQAIVEHVEGAKSIHIVDLAIKNGQQWTILMQALASRPKRCRVHRFKITAVTTLRKQLIEPTGSRLVSFAESMGLPCIFEVVVVPDIAQLSRDHIQVEQDEAVVVLAEYLINTMTEPPDRLDSLIRTVRSLNPCIMVVAEVEGNLNAPVFVNRFVELLFYTSAVFDCMEECMGRDEPMRKYGEATLFGEASKIILAMEGSERIVRSMKVGVWRAYFRQMGMVEKKMSLSSMYQANLVARKLPCWSPCTAKIEGKGLMIGWKGTPINSVTAWNFK